MHHKIRLANTTICILLAVLLFLPGCTSPAPSGAGASSFTFSELEDFNGQPIGSLSGTTFTSFLDENLSDVEHLYYDDLGSQIEAVNSGEVAAICLDQPVARLVVANHPELAIFPQDVTYDIYGFAFRQNDPLVQKVNDIVQKLTEDGTTANIAKVWFSTNEDSKRLPQFDDDPAYDKSEGVIRFGIDTVYEPMTYINSKGDIVGYDVDLMSRIAHELNMKLELVPTYSGERIEALEDNRIDIAGSCMSITEERKERVDFSVPYYIGGAVLVVKAENTAESAGEPLNNSSSAPEE